MATVKFKPNDTAPSDSEKTVYNVFVKHATTGTTFVGYIYKDWMEYWWFMVDGKKAPGGGQSDRCELFQIIKKKYA